MNEFQTAYGPRVSPTLDTGTEGGAKQSFKEESDINFLMGKYLKTGVLPEARPGVFMDVSELGDYRSLIDRGREIEDLFMQLPSEIRDEFDHDVMSFLEFASDPENADQLVELGLIEGPEPVPDPVPEPDPVPPPAEPEG